MSTKTTFRFEKYPGKEKDLTFKINLTLIELKQHTLMPPIRANARLSPRGSKLLKSQRLQSCPFWGKDVRRTGRGLSNNIFLS